MPSVATYGNITGDICMCMCICVLVTGCRERTTRTPFWPHRGIIVLFSRGNKHLPTIPILFLGLSQAFSLRVCALLHVQTSHPASCTF